MIRVTNQLTEQERKSAKALIASCQAHDQTFREPYLSNMLNFDPIMPAFFLYYQEGKLLGLLTVYADNEDVEVSFLVDPSYRRHGIARAMYRSFEKEMASYPIRSVTFQTERVFLDHHPDLASHWGLVEDEETETWLGRDRTPYALDSRSDVKVLLAEPYAIAHLHHQAFSDAEETLEVSRRYITEALKELFETWLGRDRTSYGLFTSVQKKVLLADPVDLSGNSKPFFMDLPKAEA